MVTLPLLSFAIVFVDMLGLNTMLRGSLFIMYAASSRISLRHCKRYISSSFARINLASCVRVLLSEYGRLLVSKDPTE